MNKENIIVIASYPPQGEKHHNSIGGGASYTKNTIQSLQKTLNKHHKELEYSIIVLAEQLEGTNLHYQEDSIQVKRIWRRNSLFALYFR